MHCNDSLTKEKTSRQMYLWHPPFTALGGIPDCHHWANVPEWLVQDQSESSQLLLHDVAWLVGERDLYRLDVPQNMLQPTSMATHY